MNPPNTTCTLPPLPSHLLTSISHTKTTLGLTLAITFTLAFFIIVAAIQWIHLSLLLVVAEEDAHTPHTSPTRQQRQLQTDLLNQSLKHISRSTASAFAIHPERTAKELRRVSRGGWLLLRLAFRKLSYFTAGTVPHAPSEPRSSFREAGEHLEVEGSGKSEDEERRIQMNALVKKWLDDDEGLQTGTCIYFRSTDIVLPPCSHASTCPLSDASTSPQV